MPLAIREQSVSVRFKSSSGSEYSLTVSGRDGKVYCSCPAWKFSGRNGGGKSCKHIQTFERKTMFNPDFEVKDGMVL